MDKIKWTPGQDADWQYDITQNVNELIDRIRALEARLSNYAERIAVVETKVADFEEEDDDAES